MRNLIIGSDGFIGKTFTDFLEKKGEEVIKLDIKHNPLKEDIRYITLDLANIDRVYVLAWHVGGSKFLTAEDLQREQLEWNIQLLQNLLPQLAKANKPFLFISSQFSHDNNSVYGVTKRLGEIWTNLLGGLVIRQSNVYGPIEKESLKSRVVSDFISQAIETGEIKMLTNGEEYRNFIHIQDICEAWYKALNDRLQGVYDLYGEPIKILDLAKIIARLTGAKIRIGEKLSFSPKIIPEREIPGFSTNINLEAGLIDMIDKYKNLKN